MKYTSSRDAACQRFGLHTVVVCYSAVSSDGLEILWRKVTEKVKGGQVHLTYLGYFSIRILVLGQIVLRKQLWLEAISGEGTFTPKESFRSMMIRLIRVKSFVLQRRKLRCRKSKWFTQDHIVS